MYYLGQEKTQALLLKKGGEVKEEERQALYIRAIVLRFQQTVQPQFVYSQHTLS